MKPLIILLNFICMITYGQVTINPISILMPANPPANVSEWNTLQPLMVTAKIQNGSPKDIKPDECKMVISIKKNGGKICGKFTAETARYFQFNSVVATISKDEILSQLGDCSLKPGQYELCVEFFGFKNRVMGSSCKTFTIGNDKDVSYSPPTLVSPENGAIINAKDSKKLVTFRWTPLVPKPKETVVYQLLIWQVLDNQQPLEAARVNQPVFTQSIKDATQSLVNLSQFNNCFSGLCQYVWMIRAENAEGRELGNSEFSILKIDIEDPSPGCFEIDTSAYKVECKGFDQQGRPIYHLSNLILKNVGNNPGRTGLHNMPATNYITPSSFSILGLSPASATNIPPGGSTPISFDLYNTVGSTASFVINSTIISPNNPNVFCDKVIGAKVDLPACICKDCDGARLDMTNINANPINPASGIYELAGSMGIIGLPSVYAIEMQVMNYNYSVAPSSCSAGVTGVENSGVIRLAGSSINGTQVVIANETISGLPSSNNGVTKNVKVTNSNAMPSSIPFKLQIAIPAPLTGINADCCELTHEVCLRIKVYYDKEKCNSCTFLYCFPKFKNK